MDDVVELPISRLTFEHVSGKLAFGPFQFVWEFNIKAKRLELTCLSPPKPDEATVQRAATQLQRVFAELFEK